MSLGSFQKLEKIGEGTYGIVYKAIDKSTGKTVALKKIRPESENEGIPPTTIREVIILKNMKHPNIIDLTEVVHNDEKMYLVFEYVESDLKKLMIQYDSEKRRIPQKTIKDIAYQLLSGIDFCHMRNIFHRDIKPQNILIGPNFEIKIADFGLARAAGIPLREYTTEIVTLWYRPPEILIGNKYYDASIDIWAIGCILVELNTLNPLFMGDSEIDQLHKIFNILGIPTENDLKGIQEYLSSMNFAMNTSPTGFDDMVQDKKLLSLIKKMLVYNPLKRITAREALLDDYFRDE